VFVPVTEDCVHRTRPLRAPLKVIDRRPHAADGEDIPSDLSIRSAWLKAGAVVDIFAIRLTALSQQRKPHAAIMNSGRNFRWQAVG